ncbi:uncharacterized protein LOC130654027 isoform X2 [Hydractinia symbiolongicarpus]|uniref:uncharacterized protein LOC130654027 isoform X2 n=1 Tax=Hydractinia symbiolongicarpus TaxID=13093 RepID=UPI00255160E4|nr:uncharacterized protein LOC130654027 isoform X2 [Hydractinia symbiolongicarpus]
MEFPSVQKIHKRQERIVDPFSGSQNMGTVLPSLADFLKITNLTHYSSKLKKLKCAETEDLQDLSVRVGFLHVEEQRVRRYLDYFHRKVLTQAESKRQPVSLDNFFILSKLQHVTKQIKKLGVVEFDDLPWINYSDLATMLPKKVELFRFKRYIEKVHKAPEAGVVESCSQAAVVNLSAFTTEAKIKKHKGTFERLGVVEVDDLFSITRSDLPKLTQVEYDRFVRYKSKYKGSTTNQTSSADNVDSPIAPQLPAGIAPKSPAGFASQSPVSVGPPVQPGAPFDNPNNAGYCSTSDNQFPGQQLVNINMPVYQNNIQPVFPPRDQPYFHQPYSLDSMYQQPNPGAPPTLAPKPERHGSLDSSMSFSQPPYNPSYQPTAPWPN